MSNYFSSTNMPISYDVAIMIKMFSNFKVLNYLIVYNSLSLKSFQHGIHEKFKQSQHVIF